MDVELDLRMLWCHVKYLYRWCDVYGFILEKVLSVRLQKAKGWWFNKSVLQIWQSDSYYVYIIIVSCRTFVIYCGLNRHQKTGKKIVYALWRGSFLLWSIDQWLCTSRLDADCWPHSPWFWYWICQSGNENKNMRFTVFCFGMFQST